MAKHDNLLTGVHIAHMKEYLIPHAHPNHWENLA